MGKAWDRKIIFLKQEVTEGTAPVGLEIGGVTGLKVLNYRPTLMDADFKTIPYEKAYLGADMPYPVGLKRGASFDMIMAGQGTGTGLGVPPWMYASSMCCGFGAGVPATAKVVQSPISVIPSASLATYIDDLRIETNGARGSVGFTIEDDEFPRFSFNLLGRPATDASIGVSEATGSAPTFASGYPTPLLASTDNSTFTLGGYALALRRWEMNGNGDLQFRSLIGPSDRVAYRNRAWSGTIVGELPSLAAKNYFTNVKSNTPIVAAFIHGSVAGNIVRIDCPNLQISGNIDITEEGGQIMITLPVTAVPVAGNDEIVFTSS